MATKLEVWGEALVKKNFFAASLPNDGVYALLTLWNADIVEDGASASQVQSGHHIF